MILLAPLSLLYRLGLAVDRALKTLRRKKLPKPVVSIGNISVGGTGKTPLVIKILSDLTRWGFKPAVLTRGYHSKSGFSDEAALISKYHPEVPVGVGPDRAESAGEILAKNNVDVFVLDDGFQHWALERDVDVVCVDAASTDNHLLPWGRLREPKSALKRADVIVATRLELLDERARENTLADLSRFSDGKSILSSAFKTVITDWKSGHVILPSDLKRKKLIAVSGVARPRAFEEGLGKLGIDVIPFSFSDHHHYSEADLKKIENVARKKEADVITTEKDLVKFERTRWSKALPPKFRVLIAAVRHEFSESDEHAWRKAIVEKISTPS